jgi:predicted adenylyl cyclase CyaB
MSREIEIKLKAADPAAARGRLIAAGGTPVARVLETDRLLDTADRALHRADMALRLRRRASLPRGAVPAACECPSATLTFKGPRAATNFKQREEIETPIENVDEALVNLARAGLRVAVEYQKRRETWRLDECEVTLDELPAAGWFVEIEGPSEIRIDGVRRQLGLSEANVVAETYADLAVRYGRTDPDGCPRLLFCEPAAGV